MLCIPYSPGENPPPWQCLILFSSPPLRTICVSFAHLSHRRNISRPLFSFANPRTPHLTFGIYPRYGAGPPRPRTTAMRPIPSLVPPAIQDCRRCKIEEYSMTRQRRVHPLRRLVLLLLCVLVPEEGEKNIQRGSNAAVGRVEHWLEIR